MDQLAEIKQKLNITDIIGEYIQLSKAGRNYKAVCPFHVENTPSFMVSPELQIYKCFGCGEAGDIFSFVQKIEGIDFKAALEKLAEKAGIELQITPAREESKKKRVLYEINHLSAEFYHKLLTNHKVGTKALEYLKGSRKISDVSIGNFKLGYAPDSWDILFRFLKKRGYEDKDLVAAGVVVPKKAHTGYIDKFRGRVMFPFMDLSGRIVGFSGRTIFERTPKYLNTAETAIFHKSDYLYGLYKAKLSLKKEGAVFVEGPSDVISAHQAGITNVIASSGTSLTLGQLDLVVRYTKDIAFCFDSDTAGITAIMRAIELAEKKGFDIKVIMVPSEFKDLDEFIKADLTKATKFVKNAVSIYDFFLAAALRKYNTTDATDKKRLVEFLVPIFAKITDAVQVEHYVKKLSTAIDTSEELLFNLIKGKAHISDFKSQFQGAVSSANGPFALSLEEYILALLLKSDIDTISSILYKLSKYDIAQASGEIQHIFSILRRYVATHKRFNIKWFVGKIDTVPARVVNELYLWDFEGASVDEDFIRKELEAGYKRLKRESIRRKMAMLSEQLKVAELSKDTEEVVKISEKIKQLSKRLQ